MKFRADQFCNEGCVHSTRPCRVPCSVITDSRETARLMRLTDKRETFTSGAEPLRSDDGIGRWLEDAAAARASDNLPPPYRGPENA